MLLKHISKEETESALIVAFSRIILEAIEEHGTAHILLSGGGTPKNLYARLSQEDLPWNKVVIGLVDERFVPQDHEKNNGLLIQQHLLQNEAKQAMFIPMIYDANDLNVNLEEAIKQYKLFENRLDIVLLGMGSDGHTASLFPNDASSNKGLQDDFEQILLNTEADVAPFLRVSCSKKMLLGARNLFLFITGEEKIQVLKNADSESLPIASFMQTNTILNVYYN